MSRAKAAGPKRRVIRSGVRDGDFMIPDDGGIRQRAIAGFASTLPRIIPMSAAATAVRATCAFAETWQLAVTDVEGLESLQIEWG